MCSATLVCFPGPDGMAPSRHYAVRLTQAMHSQDSFCYESTAQVPDRNKSESLTWTSFDHDGPVSVRVTPLGRESTSCRILPGNLGIVARRDGESWVFTLPKPAMVSVEFDGDITHGLLILSRTPERSRPDPRSPGLLWFKPGVHHLPEGFRLTSGQTLYLEGGAYVHGVLHGKDVSNVRIQGRGVLSGRNTPKGPHLIRLDGRSDDAIIEGVTLIDAPGFFITARGSRTQVRDVAMAGWWFNTDGVAAGKDSVVERCFLKCNDDAIKLYHSGMQVRDCVIWQMENGAPFQLSWNSKEDTRNCVVKNCDVIRVDHAWDNPNEAVINAIHGGSGRLGPYLFEDLRIENAAWRLLGLSIRHNKFSSSKTLGSIHDLTLRNVSWNTPDFTPPQRLNYLQGASTEACIENVVIDNLVINGKAARNATEAYLFCDPGTVRDVRFTSPLGSEAITPHTPSRQQPPASRFTGDTSSPFTGLNSYGQRDFHLLQAAGAWNLVATECANPEWGQRGIILYRSDDLHAWREHAFLVNRAGLPLDAWYRDHITAPEIHPYAGKFYLVFSARNERTSPGSQQGIAIAVADAVDGPYRIITADAPLVLGSNPSLFDDPAEGLQLLWDHDGRLWNAKVDPQAGRLLSSPACLWPTGAVSEKTRIISAPSLFADKGRLYLLMSSFSAGYHINVATAPGLAGPWVLQGDSPLLTWSEDDSDTVLRMPYSSGTTFAPPTEITGQAQVINVMGQGLLLAYHSSDKYSEPYLCLDPLTLTREGKLSLPSSTPAQHMRKQPAPGPEEVRMHAGAESPRSENYTVSLLKDGKEHSLHCYSLPSQWVTNVSADTAWVSFDLNGPVTLRIRPTATHTGHCSVKPERKGIKPRLTPEYVEIEIREQGQYSVEFEQGRIIRHPLVIFANPPARALTGNHRGKLHHFKPGFHDIGHAYELHDDDTVLIEEGAWVCGQFFAKNSKNIRITGRGILSGERYPARSANHMISMKDCDDIVIEDITIVNAPRFNISLTGHRHHVDNVKMIGWWFSTDGVGVGNDSLIENCFIKVNDDAIKLYRGGLEVRNCVIWQMENGAPFMLSWNTTADQRGFHVHDIDIIRCEHEWNNDNLALIAAVHGSSGKIGDYLFENIFVDEARWRFLHLVTRPNRFASWDPTRGALDSLTFKNIQLRHRQMLPSLVSGHDRQHPIHRLRFEGISIEGIPATNAEEAGLNYNEATTADILFR